MEPPIRNKPPIRNTFAADRVIFRIGVFTVLLTTTYVYYVMYIWNLDERNPLLCGLSNFDV